MKYLTLPDNIVCTDEILQFPHCNKMISCNICYMGVYVQINFLITFFFKKITISRIHDYITLSQKFVKIKC